MTLPTAYLTSAKNLSRIFDAIKTAQAPERFTVRFLESLGFKSSPDRLIIGVLKSIKFLDDTGKPTQRYFEFLDQTQSGRTLADGVRDAYEDLFRVNINAHTMSKREVVNKLKTLSQGQLSESVLDKMAMTFANLVRLADFSALPPRPITMEVVTSQDESGKPPQKPEEILKTVNLGGLVYNIQLILPESRDPAVYDALFKSLKEHLS